MSQADVVRTYIEWSQDGRVVSSEDLHNQFPLYSVNAIHNFLHSTKIKSYLVERHDLLPPPRAKSRHTLSDEQRRWLAICTNPYTTRSLNTMIASDECVGWMNMEKHRRWMKQQAFFTEYQRLIAMETKGVEGEAVRRTATRAMQGDPKSVELFYRMKGEPLPNALAPGQGGGVSIDRVMQALQIICTPDQMTQFAALIMNPEAPPPAALEAVSSPAHDTYYLDEDDEFVTPIEIRLADSEEE